MNRALLVLLAVFPVFSFGRLGGRARIDSLTNELSKTKSDTNRVNFLNNIAYSYNSIDPDKGIDVASQALKLAQQLNWKKGIANAYNSYYTNYLSKGMLDSALWCSMASLKINEDIGNRRSIAVNYGNAANVYQAKGNFTKALEFQFKSLKIREELKDSALIGTCLMNIGNIYQQLGDMKKQLAYHGDALKIFEKMHDAENISQCYMNIGNDFYLLKDYARALDYFFKALKQMEEADAQMWLQKIIGNIGSTYLAQGNYPLALQYSFRALNMCIKTGDLEGVPYEKADIGSTYLALAKAGADIKLPDSLAATSKHEFVMRAIFYLKSAINDAKELSDLALLYQSNRDLSEAYSLAGDYKASLEAHKLYTTIKDSLFSVDNKVKVAQFETQRESDLKEKQIEINRLAKVEERRKQQLLLAGIAFLLFITVVVIRTNNRQKKANQQLAAEKETSDRLRSDLEATLDQKNLLMEKISDAANMKSKFFANISHELRTPVTILTGMLDLMKEKTETGTDKKKLEVAHNNSLRLQYMVEEMLDLSKLEKSEKEIKYEIKEITPLIKRMAYAFSSYIEQANISFLFEDNGIKNIFISTDEEKLEKIVTNLIYNAVKFNKKGGAIRVSLSLSSDNNKVSVLVSDTGIGIGEKDLPHIFDRYYQSDSSAVKAKGVGIGLSLVKELTTLLGGTVDVTSKVEEGSTFELKFPVYKTHTDEVIAEPETIIISPERWDFDREPTVLLVEDNQEMRFYLREVLQDNVKLVEAENGKQALKWLETNEPDMIITDIMMPEMDGREFITNLKSSEKHKLIPIITVSALADIENQLATLRMGIDDYIVKPFNPSELRIRVHNLLHNLQERKIFNRQQPEPDDVAADSTQATEFKSRITDFVLSRMKNYDVTVYDLAYEFALSERQLYRLAKSLTGCTPAQLIKEVKLQKAYELLVGGGVYKVETVAKEVGFENISYFTKQFAERFGKKPSEFL
jgi:signal transduction histidine kinase/DNA-binding response OmpR family regulator